MGNNTTKEVRGQERRPDSASGASAPTSPTDRQPTQLYASRSGGRGSRPDLSIFGIGSSNHNELPERRETKQEREARKLEKERIARIKERERSLKEEHIDGGYLVTMGVYTGTEDFNKAIVRQLMIERRIAPFWRGLNDFREDWTEHQLVAAGRGLPIPAADEIPEEELTRPVSPESPHISSNNLQNLMVPISSRSHSAASDVSANLSPSHPAFSSPSGSSPPASPHSSSPFRPRTKTLASLTTSSKNPSSSEMVPREIQLPKDPFVNGQAIEVFLYKDSTECPICFLYYPPYLNKTRCCDQPICSECFVQIKRPDPHPPEHEHNDSSHSPPPLPETSAEAEALVSEPACCPYCQQPEFGVTYEPPPFRRGLSYANPNHGLGSFASAMSSSSSLNSTGSPTTLTPHTHKRRTTSISANASTVITTDKVRPDWATKLANARSHLARRSAAATALHTAAYLIGNGSVDNRGFGFSSRSRFSRHRGDNSSGASGSATPAHGSNDPGVRGVSDQTQQLRGEAQQPGHSRRRSRMEDLEEMMMMEAIRLSLAAEEERKRKEEKEAAKDAKKKAKEEKKKDKKERRGVYGSGASSASGSALSLSLPGLGRRRGNSGGSNLAKEVTPENTEHPRSKGKGIDRNSASAPIDFTRSGGSVGQNVVPGARHLDTTTLNTIQDLHQSSPSPTAPDKPSHLRQMSNASSPASSFVESTPGSLRNNSHTHGSSSSLDTPNVSAINIAGNRSSTPEGGDSGNAGSEPMFNFQSLAAMIGDEDDDKADAARHIEHLRDGAQSNTSHHVRYPYQAESSAAGNADDIQTSGLDESIATLKVGDANERRNVAQNPDGNRQTTLLEPQNTTPEVMVTSVTPAAANQGEEDGKQLGAGSWSQDLSREVTQ